MSAKRPKNAPIVMLATDGSEASDGALGRAIIAAKATGARIHVVHVITLPIMPAAGPEGLAWMRVLPEMRAKAQAVVKKAEKAIERAGLAHSHNVMEGQDAAGAIVKEAEKVGAGLVVVGSHGRTGIRRMLLGSVAERVVRFAHCPVLVVR